MLPGKQLARASVAGCLATVPMTVAMEWMHRWLPPEQRYPLPPRQLAMVLARRLRLAERLSADERFATTLALHFAVGAAGGALAGTLPASAMRRILGGIGYGLGFWSVSYLLVLPGSGLLRSALEHPPRRNALMIAAHLVWGSSLSVMLDALCPPEQNSTVDQASSVR